jgi:hypothetical protein
MKSDPNWISYLHKFFWNFSQHLASVFGLFSSRVIFNSKNRCHGVPPVTLFLSASGPLISTPFPRGYHTPAPALHKRWLTVPWSEPCRPDSPTVASPHATPTVVSKAAVAPLHRFHANKCAALPCFHAEPTALTSLPPSPLPSHLSTVFPHRSPPSRACPSAVHASLSMPLMPSSTPSTPLPSRRCR